MLEFLLYFTPTYLISYFTVTKLCKNCSFFNYIGNKTSRGVTSLFIILGIFILISILLDRFNLNENILNILLGLNVGIVCTLISQIKYPKNC
ncbi:hypothetical protein [Clostridium sp.]|uniref:hypothetical protein n=1 Tax=Clostridium sp. TaxID=1506 RepID=UPI001B68D976|nr:hypothetical protein [Clostridium sp.]MBP3916334.1 hypothetical protein [Clostridium sp.]